jgi:Na+-transporting NADH:ubiquinone oxidoreductase subunit NqrB
MAGLDARNYQILFLSTFLALGIFTRDWTLRLDLIGLIFLSCLLTQGLLSQPKKFDLPSLSCLKSACITALGLSLLLRGNHGSTMILAGVLAIASKFLLQVQGKHFFNPANFGIISALALTQDAWVSPGQWGADWWYLLLFLGTGAMVLKQVGRWDTTATFLVTYITLGIIRNTYLGWSWDVLHHQLMSGSLLLFAFFMITDPRSIPNAVSSRIIWAIALAFLTFILQYFFFIANAFFWALFILSPLIVILDMWETAPRFTWNQTIIN